ncbi:MAG: galactofuranosyltransferase [Bacteroidaceae bacterium]|nr:galactofuranosyltransferase [Bacteroidaceae bacterium]
MSYRFCFISHNYRGVESSGNKAKTDNEATLRQMGATNLGLPTTYYNNKVVTFFLDLAGVLKSFFCMRQGDVLLLQYPVKKYFSLICRVARWRGVRPVALIHDLGSMRRKRLSVRHEIRRLSRAEYIIASNATMAQWLLQQGLQRPVGALGLFDYRSQSVAPQRSDSVPSVPSLVYAGVLATRKNTFLLDLCQKSSPHYRLDIYGNRDGLPGLGESALVRMHDFMPAETFIAGVEGDFGLVWDGDSVDSCTGSFGEYLRWNSPHKVSFYLRAGLPIIIWREAAVASIIEQEGIGLCIGSLSELDTLLPTITPAQMQTMRRNVQRISNKLASGGFLQDALNKI